ncbi:DUF4123 domain-containing protein [Iodobacter sp.]|uniref:DUF4123 domain-containing protein n=1 Tax=Iodobacter sp. TaxID=1915058 RepID=UPI0025E6AECA|nr:DUF4123 domain-containing protein [Iodobacter sp.]
MLNEIQTTVLTSLAQGEKWYATLDASQIPALQQAEWKNQQAAWRNLLEGSAEGTQPDLTAWLLPLTQSSLEFTLNLSIDYPHAVTWLNSQWSIDEIAGYWCILSDVKLPNGHTGLCRFYDPCVLAQLERALSKPQWQRLLAPVTQWIYLDPFGQVKQQQPQPLLIKRASSLHLKQKQLDLLNKENRPHWLIAQLMANEHVPLERNNFGLFARVHDSVQLLEQYGLNRAEQQYTFCALTLDWDVSCFHSPRLNANLALVAKRKIDLLDAIEQESAPQ